jgi:hypothetical protein
MREDKYSVRDKRNYEHTVKRSTQLCQTATGDKKEIRQINDTTEDTKAG